MTNPFDLAVMGWIQQNCHNPVFDGIFPVITYLGEAGAVWLVLTVILLCRKSTRILGVTMLLALAAGFLTGELVVKNLVCRPRPFQTVGSFSLLISPPSGYSFPSGHSCSSFAAATVICRRSRKWGVPALLLAGLIAFSRLFLFVHWPTDVLAGIALGVCFGLLSCWAVGKCQRAKET